MKEIGKGVLVILITLGLWAGACYAGTRDEFNSLLENKILIHNGTCTVDEKGNIVKTADAKDEVLCKAGVSPEDQDHHFIVVYDKNGEALKVVKLNVKTYEQEVLWRRGTEV